MFLNQRKALGLIGVAAGLPSLAVAMTPYSPTAQTRYVTVEARVTSSEAGDFDSNDDSASGFSTFSSAVGAFASLSDPNQPRGAGSSASQLSDFLASSIVATGAAGAYADPNMAFNVSSIGESGFVADFDISAPTPFELNGVLDAADNGGSPYASIAIFGPTGTLINLDTSGGPVPIGLVGVMTPGSYTIAILALAEIGSVDSSAGASFDVTLTFVPEPSSILYLAVGLICLRRICGVGRRALAAGPRQRSRVAL